MNIIKELREEKMLSIRQLAKHLNVTRQTIIKWEKGTATPSEIQLRKIDNESDLELKGVIEKTIERKQPKSYININQIVNNVILVLLFISTIIFGLRTFSENITAPQKFNLIIQKIECGQEKCIYRIIDKLNSEFPNDYIELKNLGNENQYFVRIIKEFDGYKIIEYSVIQF